MRGRCAGRSACRCRSDERCISVTASRGTREARGVRAGGWPVGVRVVMGAGFCLLSFVSDVCDCIGSYFIELLYERAACVIRVPWKYGLWSLSPATSVISLLGSRDRHKGEALWGWGWARARGGGCALCGGRRHTDSGAQSESPQSRVGSGTHCEWQSQDRLPPEAGSHDTTTVRL